LPRAVAVRHGDVVPEQRATPGLLARAPWLPAVCIALAVALHVGSLGDGLQLDDRLYTRLIAAHLSGQPMDTRWYELAGVVNHGGAAGVARNITAGQLPWWTDPEAGWAMFRPVAIVTHYADMLLWPDAPQLMHAHNLLWQGVLLLSAWLLYRRLCSGPGVALWALVLCGFAARNGEVVGWLATRNSVMMPAFAALALYCHDRARRDGWGPGRALSALCLLMSLWSSEGGVCVWGALLAHALWVDRGAVRARLIALVPMAAVTLAWLVHYRVAGFGARGGTLYVDPVGDPLGFAAVVPARMGQMLSHLLGLPTPTADAYPMVGATLAVVTALSLLALSRVDRRLRMWLTSGVIALVPLCAAVPSDRMLLWPGLCLCAALGEASVRLWSAEGRVAWLGRPLVATWLVVHVLLGASLVPGSGSARAQADGAIATLAESLPPHTPGAPTRIVLNTPQTIPTLFALLLSSDQFLAPGAHLLLGASTEPVVLWRVAPHALRLRTEHGYLLEPGSRGYRRPDRPLRRGRHFAVGEANLIVEEVTADGRPRSVLLSWPKAGRLEDAPVQWVAVVHDGRALRSVAITLPAVGSALQLPLTMP